MTTLHFNDPVWTIRKVVAHAGLPCPLRYAAQDRETPMSLDEAKRRILEIALNEHEELLGRSDATTSPALDFVRMRLASVHDLDLRVQPQEQSLSLTCWVFDQKITPKHRMTKFRDLRTVVVRTEIVAGMQRLGHAQPSPSDKGHGWFYHATSLSRAGRIIANGIDLDHVMHHEYPESDFSRTEQGTFVLFEKRDTAIAQLRCDNKGEHVAVLAFVVEPLLALKPHVRYPPEGSLAWQRHVEHCRHIKSHDAWFVAQNLKEWKDYGSPQYFYGPVAKITSSSSSSSGSTPTATVTACSSAGMQLAVRSQAAADMLMRTCLEAAYVILCDSATGKTGNDTSVVLPALRRYVVDAKTKQVVDFVPEQFRFAAPRQLRLGPFVPCFYGPANGEFLLKTPPMRPLYIRRGTGCIVVHLSFAKRERAVPSNLHFYQFVQCINHLCLRQQQQLLQSQQQQQQNATQDVPYSHIPAKYLKCRLPTGRRFTMKGWKGNIPPSLQDLCNLWWECTIHFKGLVSPGDFVAQLWDLVEMRQCTAPPEYEAEIKPEIKPSFEDCLFEMEV